MPSNELVTREKLTGWGFVQLKDTWLYCRFRKQHEYFETWWHPSWNYTALLGWPEDDPLEQTAWEFLARVQRRFLEQSDGEKPDDEDPLWALMDDT